MTDAQAILPKDRLEWVEAWGMASRSMAHVFRPSTVEGVAKVFALARSTGRTVALKGGGNSYGDAFQNREGIVLDLSRMIRVLDWNPETGIIDVEPGVRIVDLWQYVVEDGWWPPVVSGTMFTTMGGCAAMNIHGKNAYKAGPFGNHVLEFDFMTPDGKLHKVSPKKDRELFHGAISGFGMLGVFTRIRLQLKKIAAGCMRVFPQRVQNFEEHIDGFEQNAASMDYMVGWADCYPTAKASIGRGEMHFAEHVAAEDDSFPAQSMRVQNQNVSDMMLRYIPKSILWRFMPFAVNDLGVRCTNIAKYLHTFIPSHKKPYLQSHAAFHFLLDFVPNWKRAYLPGGLIQYQSFVPKKHAARVFAEQIRRAAKRGIRPYLGVTKKHKPDPFLLTHGLDGFSLALDFPVTASNRKALWRLCHEMDEIVLAAGGRFYFAKDSTMRPGTPERFFPAENLAAFRRLKHRCDPDGILTSELFRRVFADSGGGEETWAGVRATA